MRKYDGDADDEKELLKLRAESWMIDLLKLNPAYVHWGPREDYMGKHGDDEPWHEERKKLGMPERKHGWEARILFKNWKEHTVALDELNEVVNFYFSVDRASKECETCKGTGYHPDAQWVSESFYDHMLEEFMSEAKSVRPLRDAMVAKYGEAFQAFWADILAHGAWHTRITQDEVETLVSDSRLYDFTHTYSQEQGWQPKEPPAVPTAQEVNDWHAGKLRGKVGGFGHDAINRMILIEQRCKRLGLPQTCPPCEGHGTIFTAEEAHVELTYWLLHPRKGASRGVEVARIEREELPQVLTFLKQAAERNAERFAKAVDAARRCS